LWWLVAAEAGVATNAAAGRRNASAARRDVRLVDTVVLRGEEALREGRRVHSRGEQIALID
jgi:hypothetical protein